MTSRRCAELAVSHKPSLASTNPRPPPIARIRTPRGSRSPGANPAWLSSPEVPGKILQQIEPSSFELVIAKKRGDGECRTLIRPRSNPRAHPRSSSCRRFAQAHRPVVAPSSIPSPSRAPCASNARESPVRTPRSSRTRHRAVDPDQHSGSPSDAAWSLLRPSPWLRDQAHPPGSRRLVSRPEPEPERSRNPTDVRVQAVEQLFAQERRARAPAVSVGGPAKKPVGERVRGGTRVFHVLARPIRLGGAPVVLRNGRRCSRVRVPFFMLT